MSGHSKWSSIKHKKGAADAKRGKLFSKLSRAIIVAAKEGGPDPDANINLANAIERARAVSMPKDNIERAIARGAGADANSEAYDSVTYEGYGASGAALIVEALTDNRNRTAADVRFAFGKYGGSLGAPGSVAWMFERKGVITVPLAAVDEEMGIVLFRLDFGDTGNYGPGNALTTFEAFKVYGGQIHVVEAFIDIMPVNTPSGWPNYEVKTPK